MNVCVDGSGDKCCFRILHAVRLDPLLRPEACVLSILYPTASVTSRAQQRKVC